MPTFTRENPSLESHEPHDYPLIWIKSSCIGRHIYGIVIVNGHSDQFLE